MHTDQTVSNPGPTSNRSFIKCALEIFNGNHKIYYGINAETNLLFHCGRQICTLAYCLCCLLLGETPNWCLFIEISDFGSINFLQIQYRNVHNIRRMFRLIFFFGWICRNRAKKTASADSKPICRNGLFATQLIRFEARTRWAILIRMYASHTDLSLFAHDHWFCSPSFLAILCMEY